MGTLLKSEGEVDGSLRDALVATYTGTRSADEKTQKKAAAYVSVIKNGGQWFCCGCKGFVSDKSPVMYGQTVPKGRLGTALVRNGDRPVHLKECVFAKSAEPGGVPNREPLQRDPNAGLGMIKIKHASGTGSTGKLVTTKSSISLASSGKTLPSLARVLFTLMDKAELNCFRSKSRSLSSDGSAIEGVASNQYMDSTKKLSAKDYVFGSLYKVKSKLKPRLKADINKVWPDSLQHHGFIVDLVGDVVHDKINKVWNVKRAFGVELFPVQGKVTMPGAGTCGPYVMIGLITFDNVLGEAIISQAYLQPALGYEDLYPVDSQLERDTFSLLRDVAIKNKWSGSIIKPIYDEKIGTDTCRPDFIIEMKGSPNKLIIETMGYDSDDYLERKERTHKIMECLGTVVSHRPGDNDEELVEKVESFMRAELGKS